MTPRAFQALEGAFGERLLRGQPLAAYTSARIGGPAEALLVARTVDDLREAARAAWTDDVPLLVLGGGCNVLVSDAGVRGLVVINRAKGVSFEGTCARAESGTGFIRLARACIARGLAGLEWAIGIPGTVGGAVVGNAGAHGGDTAGIVEEVVLATPDGERRLDAESLCYEYRSSILKREGWEAVILTAAFALRAGTAEELAARAETYTAHRKATQPPGATMGSTFKNPPGDYAGRLIEAAGLKGAQRGGARISPIHANFFLNTGGATAGDFKALIDMAREEVQARFGVTLALEIELVGEWGE
jgi:UDP-N-acetylmuramate dehydrogenase